MTDECLNPECDNEMITIGVCVACAQTNYKPSRDGIDIEGWVHKSKRWVNQQ